MGERVGFIGLGVMGKPMATNLVRAGLDVVVHSRSPGPVDELVALGSERAGSVAEVVVTMLPDTPDVDRVIFGERGVSEGIRAGSLVVDMSTIDPSAARRL